MLPCPFCGAKNGTQCLLTVSHPSSGHPIAFKFLCVHVEAKRGCQMSLDVFLCVLQIIALTQGLSEPDALLFPTPVTPYFTDRKIKKFAEARCGHILFFFLTQGLHIALANPITYSVDQAYLECIESCLLSASASIY